MIHFKDFAPQITKRSFFKVEFESFAKALADANHWIETNRIDVVNIETVVLPEMWDEEGTADVNLRTRDDFPNDWYQFIRVWYRRSAE